MYYIIFTSLFVLSFYRNVRFNTGIYAFSTSQIVDPLLLTVQYMHYRQDLVLASWQHTATLRWCFTVKSNLFYSKGTVVLDSPSMTAASRRISSMTAVIGQLKLSCTLWCQYLSWDTPPTGCNTFTGGWTVHSVMKWHMQFENKTDLQELQKQIFCSDIVIASVNGWLLGECIRGCFYNLGGYHYFL